MTNLSSPTIARCPVCEVYNINGNYITTHNFRKLREAQLQGTEQERSYYSTPEEVMGFACGYAKNKSGCLCLSGGLEVKPNAKKIVCIDEKGLPVFRDEPLETDKEVLDNQKYLDWAAELAPKMAPE